MLRTYDRPFESVHASSLRSFFSQVALSDCVNRSHGDTFVFSAYRRSIKFLEATSVPNVHCATTKIPLNLLSLLLKKKSMMAGYRRSPLGDATMFTMRIPTIYSVNKSASHPANQAQPRVADCRYDVIALLASYHSVHASEAVTQPTCILNR